MLVAIVSDTHLPRGARRMPDACLERLRAADLILHAGDFVAASVLEELRALGPPLAAVHGNVDDAELRRALPAERVVEAGAARIAMVHDAGPRRAGSTACAPASPRPARSSSGTPTSRCTRPPPTASRSSTRDRRPTGGASPPTRMGVARIADDGAVAFELVVLE